MGGLGLGSTLHKGGFERGEVRRIRRVKALGFDELPPSFNQGEVGRVGREKTPLNRQAGGEGHPVRTARIASIVQDHRHRDPEVERGEVPQEGPDFRGRKVGVVGDGDEGRGNRLECAKDGEALAPGGGSEEEACHGPENPPEGS